jgi:hypothetical protein
MKKEERNKQKEGILLFIYENLGMKVRKPFKWKGKGFFASRTKILISIKTK